MTKITGSFEDRIQQWAAGSSSGDEGDTILSDAAIRAYLDTQVGSFGTVVTDELLIPAGAEARAQLFTDEVDMIRHWAASGMIYFDENDNLITNPMVTILRFHDDVLDQDVYEVYIDSDTG